MSAAASTSYDELRNAAPDQVRQAIRTGAYSGHTAGLAPGKLQVNLAILPEEFALDFMRFCQRNPKPCPLVGVSDTGNPMLWTLGRDIDIRTDVPQYNIYRDGRLVSSGVSIADEWRDDFVVFALGCSFTFERALMEAGVPLWHIDNNKTVSMFRTNVQTVEAGPFGGGTVVSMRPIRKESVDLAVEVSRKYPLAHGAPIHIGDPSKIGISDVSAPDWGDATPIEEGQVPVFWACGVTPQAAVERARLPVVITHKPGHMLITDVDERAEVPVLAK